MIDVLAVFLLVSTAVLYNLIKSHKEESHKGFGEIDMHELIGQMQTEKMWVRKIIYFQQILIVIISFFVLFESVFLK